MSSEATSTAPTAALGRTVQEYLGHPALAGKDVLKPAQYAQITEADLLAAGLDGSIVDAWCAPHPVAVRAAAVRQLQSAVAVTARLCPDVPVLVILRWLWALEARKHTYSLSEWVASWWDPDCPGLGWDGWLFDAAGITLEEARALAASGAVDRAALAALAALRGAALPSLPKALDPDGVR